MEYNVPQFIEEEGKILGPFNIRDFFILFGAGLASAMFFFIFRQWLAIILATIVFGGTAASLIVRVNGRPLYAIIVAAIQFFWSPRFYIWKKEILRQEALLLERPAKKKPKIPVQQTPKLPQPLVREKIKQLARQLDIKEKGPEPRRLRQKQLAEKKSEMPVLQVPHSFHPFTFKLKERIKNLAQQLDVKKSPIEPAILSQRHLPEQKPETPAPQSAKISRSFTTEEIAKIVQQVIQQMDNQSKS